MNSFLFKLIVLPLWSHNLPQICYNEVDQIHPLAIVLSFSLVDHDIRTLDWFDRLVHSYRINISNYSACQNQLIDIDFDETDMYDY
jgi:hypothetical protein